MTRLAIPIVAFAVAIAEPSAAYNYIIEESTDFTGNGCENDDLNTVTAYMRIILDHNGWSGSRFVNPGAWPQDFVESCDGSYGAGGLDEYYGDDEILAVYAGHGNKGWLQWGYKNNNRCGVSFQDNMRLGAMSGEQAAYGVWITSCTLNTSGIVPNGPHRQRLRQQFGYHNSPDVKDESAGYWYGDIVTNYKTNTAAWLDQMEDKPGWFTGENSPISVAWGSTMNSCWGEHDSYLQYDILAPRGGWSTCETAPPGQYYCYYLRNNGSSGC